VSRTAHHAPSSLSRAFRPRVDGEPWRSVLLYDLRYSDRVLADAARAGRRPRPRRVRRHVRVRSFERYLARNSTIAESATLDERAARQRLRAQTHAVRALVDSGPGTALDVDAADLVDVPPVRHRHHQLRLM
jgi:hypothetical protein